MLKKALCLLVAKLLSTPTWWDISVAKCYPSSSWLESLHTPWGKVSAQLPAGERKEISIGKQEINEHNIDFKQENNEDKWQKEAKAALSVDCPKAALPSPRYFPQHFVFYGLSGSVNLAPPHVSQSCLGEHAWINQNHCAQNTFLKRQVVFNLIEYGRGSSSQKLLWSTVWYRTLINSLTHSFIHLYDPEVTSVISVL